MPEYALLNAVIEHMEEKGQTHKTILVNINEVLVENINTKNKTDFTLEQLKKATDKCFAREWLQCTSKVERYQNVKVTPKGIGVAHSKKRSDEQKANRSIAKKISDYIEDHKGLFVALGCLVPLATFVLKITGFI